MSETIQIQLDLNTFLKLFRQAGRTSVVDVTCDNQTHPCLIHKIDIHPVTDVVRHIDFLVVDLKQKITASVPISFVGEPAKGSDGVLVKQLSSIEVEALPEKIPHEIEIDLSKLENIGDTIKISNISASSEYAILEESDSLIASLTAPAVEVEEVVGETPVEGEVTAETTEPTA